MGGFFSVDSEFHRWASLITDIVLVCLLWIVFSLPLITMGAATTAAYYVCTKKVSGRDGYIFQGFFKSFKENFVKSTIAFLISAGVITLLIINMALLDGDVVQFAGITLLVQYFIFLQVVFVTMYVFAVISRFEMGIFRAVKVSFLLANRHILFTLVHLVLLGVLFVGAVNFPLLFIFIGGVYIYGSSFLLVRIFRKHYPNFDPVVDGEIKPLRFEDVEGKKE